MTHVPSPNAGQAVQGDETISIRQRTGIWSVSINGQFYGDYTRRQWAIDAAIEKADDITARGGAAVVRTGGHQDLLYDTRRLAFAPREKDWLEQFVEMFQWRLWPAKKKRSKSPARIASEQVRQGTREQKDGRSFPVPGTVRSPV
jgi:hypothetical protein